MNTIAKALAAASLSFLVIAPASAQENRVAVPYGDLDISSAAGADTLTQRLERGARAVCGHADVRDVRSGAELSECRAEALQDARQQAIAMGAVLEGASFASID